MKVKDNSQQLVVFDVMDLEAPLEVLYKDETLWLTQKQISVLFNKERSVITKHIRNVIQSNELQEDTVCAFFAHTAEDGKKYDTRYYNLDMIISVGYRVNSIRGTQFRIWATKVLKEHLFQGYTINEKRIQSLSNGIENLRNSISIIERTIASRLSADKEVHDLLRVISDYSRDLQLLDDYDKQTIQTPQKLLQEKSPLKLEEVLKVIKQLKQIHKEMLFGRANTGALDSCVNAIYQTFDGKDVYPSLQEKAANLLYLMTKNHPFVDGNKRIAASMFLYFLNKNNALYNGQNTKLMPDGILAALTLLVAESKPQEKATMISLIMHYLNIG